MRGLGPEAAARYYQGLQQELEGQMVELPDGRVIYTPPGVTPEQMLRREQTAIGVGAAQEYGFAAGSPEAIGFMANAPWQSAQGMAQYEAAAGLGGQIYQYLGGNARALQGRVQAMAARGVSPAARQVWAQSVMGQGAVARGFGMAGAVAGQFEQGLQAALASGQMTPFEYAQFGEMANFASSALGYSAAQGVFGAEAQGAVGGFRSAMGMPLVEGAMPLHEIGPGGGIYGIGQLASRALSWNQLRQSQAYRMGTGQWATSSYGGRTYQMGMIGQIQRAELKLEQSRELYGMQAAAAAMAAQQQRAGIERAMESARLQYRQGQERLNLGFQQGTESLEQGYAQQQASFALGQRMWGVNTEFQRRQFGVQWQQMMQGQRWGREDMAFNRQQAGVQYTRGMEDINRAIRFASGREKQELLRQRGRMEEDYGVSEKRRGVEEGRQEKLWAQQAQAFKDQESHYEDIKRLETEQFEMQNEHMTQNYELQKRHMQENFDLSKKHMDESFALQMKHLQEQMGEAEAMAAMQQAIAAKQQEIAEDDMMYRLAQMTQEQKYFEEVVFPGQIEHQRLQDLTQDAYAAFLRQQLSDFSKDGDLWGKWDTLIGHFESSVKRDSSLDKAWQNLLDRIENRLNRMFQSQGDGGGSGNSLAGGGDVTAGSSYLVGEVGPEIFVPDQNGTIVPNMALRRLTASGFSVGNMNVSISVEGGRQDERQLAAEIWRKFEAELNKTASRQRMRGGLWQ